MSDADLFTLPPHTEKEQLEKIRSRIFPDAKAACHELAAALARLIREKAARKESTVLGLATGSTPVPLYRELIRLHREEGLSFRTVHTFNLDEYLGLSSQHRESYHRFMQEQLFQHIDIPPAQTHIPDGTVDRSLAYDYCRNYEAAIAEMGGLDVQILGIGRTGHIGFNEPGSGRDSRTRLVSLDRLTRRDAARDFQGEQFVPRYALTMGVGTILEARHIFLLAWGEAKAEVIAKAIEEPPGESLPASFLQGHPNAQFLLDTAAASALTRIRRPWLVGPVSWDAARTRQAVIWLSRKVAKPILKLVDEDYSENGLADLVVEAGSTYNLNIRLFNEIQHTITGWPGGKPGADDTHRPERALPHPKRVLILSPEPQEDILCLGGTLHRLVDQGHSVTVAYQTSGSLSVPEDMVRQTVELQLDILEEAGETGVVFHWLESIRQQLEKEEDEEGENPAVRRFKALLRRNEARAACTRCGLAQEHIRFLDARFYETGRYRQFALLREDVDQLAGLLRAFRPHQIFVTGDQADPSSVSSLCFEQFRQAWQAVGGESWSGECHIWLYRGAGREWEGHQIDMAVPLSPAELENKILGIYQHVSQRNQAPVGRDTTDEWWHIAGQINRQTAALYDELGLAEYEAIEAFRRWEPGATKASSLSPS